jgi:hypothetical protein
VAIFQLTEPLSMGATDQLIVTLRFAHGDGTHSLGRFRISTTSDTNPLRLPSEPEEIESILFVPPETRTAEQSARLFAFFRDRDPKWQELNDRATLTRSQAERERLTGVQDLAWALINSPAFLFNR